MTLSVLDLAMIVLPAAAYLDQYKKILKSGDTGTFNPATCGVLLVCNIIRVFFWLARRFDTVLLYQSFVMIVAQFLLLELCVRVQHRRRRPSFQIKSMKDYSSAIEATVPMPQAWNNYKRKSTFGLSWIVIMSWFGGDLFKIGYYIASGAPAQFTMCGFVQFSVDVIICYQVRIFPTVLAIAHDLEEDDVFGIVIDDLLPSPPLPPVGPPMTMKAVRAPGSPLALVALAAEGGSGSVVTPAELASWASDLPPNGVVATRELRASPHGHPLAV
ncbi:PQ-loop repeat-containing protein 1 [Allomyces javanicus]|nr:PQ-loop repeat-containing protein 1 [Allomyces javanicus]